MKLTATKSPMKYFLLLIIVSSLSILSCKPGDPAAATAASGDCKVSGRYFNRTVLDKCPGTLPVDIPNYALQLDFSGSDSVIIRNGIEHYVLPYVPTGNDCEFKIIGATQFGDMVFSVNGDSTLMLVDSAWTNVDGMSTFRHAATPNRNEWDYENFLNECVIAGTYIMDQKQGAPSRVIFLPNGQVEGLNSFLAYKLCVAGDCLEETEPAALTIDFTTRKGDIETYVVKMPDGHKLLQFYSIGAPIADQKGGRPVGALAFEVKAPAGMENE